MLVGQIFDVDARFTVDSLLTTIAANGFKVSRASVFRTLNILVEAEMIRENDGIYSR